MRRPREASLPEKILSCLLIALLVQPSGFVFAQAGPHPVVVSSTINDGSAQRSTVTNLSLLFNTNVNLTVSNLVLRNLATNARIDSTNFALTWDSVSNKATFTFPGLPGRSLADGNYIASLLANTVTNGAGLRLDGNGDGQPGGAYSFGLFRYFGDWNGDRDIDFWDNFWFQRSFGKVSTDTNYDARFDLNADGIVNTIDRSRFESNYFTILRPQPGITAALVNDTGLSPWDNITSDTTIAGTVIRTNPATRLQARLSPAASLQDVTALLATNGNFVFTSNLLAQLFGAPLSNGVYNLHLQTLETNNSVSATFDLGFVLEATPAECAFPDDLAGWTTHVGDFPPNWTNAIPGSVVGTNCEAVLTEADSFLVTLSRTFQPPTNSSVLSFNYSMLSFDTTSSNKIKDAFEVALVDTAGYPLAYTIGSGNDAFFNVSDGQALALAQDVSHSAVSPQLSTVRLALHPSALGTQAKLTFRLINNDQDVRTTVRIADVKFERAAVGARTALSASAPVYALPLPSPAPKLTWISHR